MRRQQTDWQQQATPAIDVEAIRDEAERRSRVGDTDIADAIARLQQSLTALEASQSAFARVSSLTLFDALR